MDSDHIILLSGIFMPTMAFAGEDSGLLGCFFVGSEAASVLFAIILASIFSIKNWRNFKSSTPYHQKLLISLLLFMASFVVIALFGIMLAGAITSSL